MTSRSTKLRTELRKRVCSSVCEKSFIGLSITNQPCHCEEGVLPDEAIPRARDCFVPRSEFGITGFPGIEGLPRRNPTRQIQLRYVRLTLEETPSSSHGL